LAVQKPYNISLNGVTIDGNEDNVISWKTSGDITTAFSIYISYNSFKDIKITSHGLQNNSLIVNTNRDSSINGIRTVTVMDANNFTLNSDITNQTVGDIINLYNQDTNVSPVAGSNSTNTTIYLSNTGSITVGDIVQSSIGGEYRFVSSVNPNTSITVSSPFSNSTAGATITAWHLVASKPIEYAWKIENYQSYATSYTLPAHSIINGKTYKIAITVFNATNQNAQSYPVVFQTSSRPVVTVDSISTITSPSYNFTAEYSQAENVAMDSYVVFLYDSNQNLIAQSNVIQAPYPPTTPSMQYIFNYLQSGSSYYIEFQATSLVGLTGTSGKINFNVQYGQPNISVNLTATNVIQIIGQTDVGTFVNNELLDVRNGSVWFQDGFSVDRDFTLKIWFQSPVHNVDLVVIKGANGQIRLQYWDDMRFHVFKDINGWKGWSPHIVSPVLSNGTQYFVCVQQIYNHLNLFANILG
jgi:hypothetical protein